MEGNGTSLHFSLVLVTEDGYTYTRVPLHSTQLFQTCSWCCSQQTSFPVPLGYLPACFPKSQHRCPKLYFLSLPLHRSWDFTTFLSKSLKFHSILILDYRPAFKIKCKTTCHFLLFFQNRFCSKGERRTHLLCALYLNTPRASPHLFSTMTAIPFPRHFHVTPSTDRPPWQE